LVQTFEQVQAIEARANRDTKMIMLEVLEDEGEEDAEEEDKSTIRVKTRVP
jgi:hypothetical protein